MMKEWMNAGEPRFAVTETILIVNWIPFARLLLFLDWKQGSVALPRGFRS
jgi:hypothetical protein